jgi:hypothetical protein
MRENDLFHSLFQKNYTTLDAVHTSLQQVSAAKVLSVIGASGAAGAIVKVSDFERFSTPVAVCTAVALLVVWALMESTKKLGELQHSLTTSRRRLGL